MQTTINSRKIMSVLLAIIMVMTMSTFMTMTVGAAATAGPDNTKLTDSVVKVNYANETLEVGTTYEFKGAPTLMYALKAPLDSNKNKSLKWFPIYGDSIDISKVIPKAPVTDEKKAYYIAVKEAGEDDILGIVEIKGRPDIKDSKNNVYGTDKKLVPAYSIGATTEEITGVSSALQYRIGSSAWLAISGTSIDVGAQYNPTGATVELRIAPDSNAGAFASTSVKVKVPAQPKAPAIKVTYIAANTEADPPVLASVKLTGLKKNTSYLYEKADGTWVSFKTGETETTKELKDLKDTAKVDVNADATKNESYVYIKLAAVETGKIAPSSAVAKIVLNTTKPELDPYFKTATSGGTPPVVDPAAGAKAALTKISITAIEVANDVDENALIAAIVAKAKSDIDDDTNYDVTFAKTSATFTTGNAGNIIGKFTVTSKGADSSTNTTTGSDVTIDVTITT